MGPDTLSERRDTTLSYVGCSKGLVNRLRFRDLTCVYRHDILDLVNELWSIRLD
jgi:hypothetical protein